VKKGQVLGKLVAKQGAEVVGQVDLVAATEVKKGSLIGFIFQVTGQTVRSLFGGK
jgi:hypothetical protein